jgi:tetratricopeptide (TPR) repeat protein
VAYSNRGWAWSGKQEYDKAIADYNAALKLLPDNPQVHYNLGIALKSKGDIAGAIAECHAVLVVLAKRLDDNPKASRDDVLKTLRDWRVNLDLAGLRDEDALAKLPLEQSEACRALWAEVDRLIARAEGIKP